MSKTDTAERPSQATTLTDISYDKFAIPEVDHSRVAESIDSSEDLYDCGENDLLWIKGTEFLIVEKKFGYFHKPLQVISEDGTQGEIVGGSLESPSCAGVAWTDELEKYEEDELNRGVLLADFDHVYQLKNENESEKLHNWVPTTSSPTCPQCDRDGRGKPIDVSRDGLQTVEVLRCVNTDCQALFRYERDLRPDQTATVLSYDGRGDDLEPVTISGLFRGRRQDDFKFPLDTNTGRLEGFYTPQEIADFINPKMVGAGKYGVSKVNTQNRRGEEQMVVRWKNDIGFAADMTISFHRIRDEELLEPLQSESASNDS